MKRYGDKMSGNREKILTLLYKKGDLTKQDIAKEIKITIPTVSSNIKDLEEEGLVAETGVKDSTGGRRPAIVSFLKDSRYSFGVDISPLKVRIILTNLNSQIICEKEFPIDSLKDINVIMGDISVIVENILEVTKISNSKILGIGFSLPGAVDENNFILSIALNLGIRDLDFNKFKDLFPFPMYIENEANAAAFAEINLGIAKEMRNLVYVSVTYGIGTGIVIKDCLYKGKNRRAGEFGHMTIIPNGKKCKCGRNGCWEMYASKKALIDSYNLLSSEKIKELRDFFSLIEKNDDFALKVFDEYLEYLAIGIQNIVLIMDPHYIVLGGEISFYIEKYIEILKSKVFKPNSFYNQGDLKIFTSKLKENSSILGASLLPVQRVFSINKKIL